MPKTGFGATAMDGVVARASGSRRWRWPPLPRAHGDRLCWIASSGLLAVHGSMLWSLVVDWPLQDDLVQILAIPGYLAQADVGGKLAELFALNPDQRVVTHRMAGWLGAVLPGGLDFRLLTVLGNAAGLAAAALIVTSLPAAMRAGAALLAALLMTSMTHWGAQYWASAAIHHFGVSFFALSALFTLGRPRGRRFAIPLAFAAAFTSANGLMVFPAAVTLSVLKGRRRDATLWLLAGAVVVSLYFVGHSAQSGERHLLSLMGDPLLLASFGLATLGGIGATSTLSIAIGAFVALAWATLIASGAWRRVPPFVLASAVFVALSCAMIAAGRAGLGAEAAVLPRYRVYSALALLLTVAALTPLAAERRMHWVLGIASAGAAGLYAVAWASTMPHVVHLAMTQTALRDHFAAAGHGHYLGFPREFGDFTLRRARDVGAYHGVLHAAPPAQLISGDPPAGIVSGTAHADLYRDHSVLSIAGWTDNPSSSIRLWLVNDHQAFSAPLVTVSFAGGTWTGLRTGFHGTVSLAGVPRGHYRAGYSSGGIRWFDGSIEVR